jgi:thiamine transport system substrate-binding protein
MKFQHFCRFRFLLFVLVQFSIPNASFATPEKPTLNIYTYMSFTSKWGPGIPLKDKFEETCQCKVNFVSVDDGATLLRRIKLENSKSKADLVLGIDNILVGEAFDSGIFEPSPIHEELTFANPAIHKFKNTFVPFDFGWVSLIYNSKKIKKPPNDLNDLLTNPSFKKSLIFSDPLTSSPGLSFLFWLDREFPNHVDEKLKLLKAQTLTITPGWSEAYGLFLKGEGGLVLSYTTSELYHKIVESNLDYKAVFFKRHPVVIEYAGITKSSSQKDLSRKFLTFLLTPQSQKILAENNWMYPVIQSERIVHLNPLFSSFPRPEATISSEMEIGLQKKLLNVWRNGYK